MKHAIQTVKENILSCFREGATKKKVLAKTTKKNLQFVPKFDIVEDIILEGYLIKYHIIGVSEISGTGHSFGAG